MIPWFNIPSPGIGAIAIHAFGVLVAIGILVGARLTRDRGRELGLTDEAVNSMVNTILVCGFLFAHFFDVLAYQSATGRPSFWQIVNPFGGLSSYGGFMGALAGLYYWTKRHKQPMMPYADSLAYGLATGWLFGRLGCFTAHDHPGRRTDFFLAVNYGNHGPGGVRHDLGLDEALWALGITLVFAVLHRRKQPLGRYVTILALAYAPVRFFLDFLRATDVGDSDPRYFGLTPGQYGSLLVLAAGIALLIWERRNTRQVAQSPVQAPQ